MLSLAVLYWMPLLTKKNITKMQEVVHQLQKKNQQKEREQVKGLIYL